MNVLRRRHLVPLVLIGCVPGRAEPAIEPTLSVTPLAVDVPVGGVVAIEASATPAWDGATASPGWRASGGRLQVAVGGEDATWTAPFLPGTYTIDVWHPHRGELRSTVTITVSEREGPVSPGPAEAWPGVLPVSVASIQAFPSAFWGDRVTVGAPAIAASMPAVTPPSWVQTDQGYVFAVGVEGRGVDLWEVPFNSSAWTRIGDVSEGTPDRVALHPSTRLVAVATGSQVEVYDVPGGVVRWAVDAGAPVKQLSWRPIDGHELFYAAAGVLYRADLDLETTETYPVGDAALTWNTGVDLIAVSDAGVCSRVFEPYANPEIFRVEGCGAADSPALTALSMWYPYDDVVIAYEDGTIESVTSGGLVRWSTAVTPPFLFERGESGVAWIWTASGLSKISLADGSAL